MTIQYIKIHIRERERERRISSIVEDHQEISRLHIRVLMHGNAMLWYFFIDYTILDSIYEDEISAKHHTQIPKAAGAADSLVDDMLQHGDCLMVWQHQVLGPL